MRSDTLCSCALPSAKPFIFESADSNGFHAGADNISILARFQPFPDYSHVFWTMGLGLVGADANGVPAPFRLGRPSGVVTTWGVVNALPYLIAWQFPPGPEEQTVLLVLKAEFRSGPDTYTVYLNPAPGSPEPATSVGSIQVDLGVITAIDVLADGRFSLDEIRVGETFEDVTPIPEPDGAWGVAACAAVWLRARRR